CAANIKKYNKTIETLTKKLNIIKAENKSLHGRIGKFLQIRKQHISKIRSNA
ncbi:8240_t:CDS:1, partial [Scutellospora calospora]